MTQQILIKRSAVAAKVPATTDIALGEIGCNTYDGVLYLQKNNGVASIVEVGAATITGDATGTLSKGAGTLTLAASGVTAGSYTGSVTVDAKGRVTAGSALTSGNVTTALGFTPYNATNPSGYLSAIPVATTTVLGGVKQGANITIAGDGTLALALQPSVNALNVISNTSVTPPSSGTLALYAQSFSNKAQLAQFDSNGRQDPLQRSLYTNNIILWMPGPGATLAINFGESYTARNNGTAAAQSAPTLVGTNLVTQMNRNIFGTGTTATGASGIQTTGTVAWIGNITNGGGFFFHARFSLETYLASERFFIGLSANNATMAADPSTWANSIGVGKDAADTTIQFMTRSATTATKINTGLTPSVSQVYDIYIYAYPNATAIQFTIMGPSNISAPLASGTISTNLPVATVFMYMQAHIQSTAGTTAKQLGLSKMYLETDL